MKLATPKHPAGSVLVTTILTVTLMALICSAALVVTSQTATTSMQTASWHQALTGAEAAADQAMNALNTDNWAGWYTVTGAPSKSQPSGGVAATAKPTAGKYNYYIPPALTVPGEGGTNLTMWTTVDNGGLPLDQNGNQAFRIRAAGTAAIAGPARASMNKLDNQLRKISLIRDNQAGTTVANPQATRRIEIIALPVAQSIWVRAMLLRNQITMSGGGIIDSFDSTNPFKSTNGLYDITKRQNHGDVATINTNGASDLKNTYVYGSLAYSGAAVKNTTNVQGTISTPFTATVPDTVKPTWPNGTYTSLSNGNPGTLTAGTKLSPAKYKIGTLTVPGGNVLTINPSNSGVDNNYIEVWVTGKFTTSGSGYITQDPNVHVKYIVEGDITVSGSSFSNQSGLAKNLEIVGIGAGKCTISGGGNFIGTINAPGYDLTVSGSSNLSGAFIANSMNISGGASVHYDESLAKNGTSTTLGNYAYGSWFEDNSAAKRGLLF